MLEKIKYYPITRYKWEWSWNGSCPYYLLQPLFLEPIKRHLMELRHITKYAIISSEYSKDIEAHQTFEEVTFNKAVRNYFEKNIQKYILEYKNLLKFTEKTIFKYKEMFENETDKKINSKEWSFLGDLLTKNNAYYLISQPELIDLLSKDLIKEIRKTYTDMSVVNKILQKITLPDETIISLKDREWHDLINRFKQNKIEKNKVNKLLFDFYWKYRSFYMINLEADIKKEFGNLLTSFYNGLEIRSRYKVVKDTKTEYEVSKRAKEIAYYIREIGALRLYAKNVWVNLTLLIINTYQRISQILDVKDLERFHFNEITNLLENGRLPKVRLNERNLSVFVISPRGINQYDNEKAMRIKNLIAKPHDLQNFVSGEMAYLGNPVGTAFVVKLQDNVAIKLKELKKIKNPILVSEQTVPAYLPLIEYVSGIITNEGGVLSHASIISREYKIPALIGTKLATKVFNTGDKIKFVSNENRAYKVEALSDKKQSEYYITPIEVRNLNEIGGKARNTALLKTFGVSVPNGLILTTKLFDEFKRDAGLQKLIKGLTRKGISDEAAIDLIAKIQFHIKNISLSKELVEKLKTYLSSYKKVIVRSSATIEDSKIKSFAGQFISVVTSVADVEDAIKRCYSGIFSLHIIKYYKDIDKLSLAILIQDYRDVDKSGVAFSINPVTKNKDEILIECVLGSCEKLVSGRALPEKILIDKNKINSGNSKLIKGRELNELIRKIEYIEDKLETPVDIEFGIERNKLWIFQARPITTL